MNNNCRFTGETKVNKEGVLLRRVAFLRGLDHNPTIGGWIEEADNLFDNAEVLNNAEVFGNARVRNNARVLTEARVYGNAVICGYAIIIDHADVSGNTCICENAVINNDAKIYGESMVSEHAIVSGNAYIEGGIIQGVARIDKMAQITNTNDYCIFQSFGSANRVTTAYKRSDGFIGISCGCFVGTLYEFMKKVEETHGDDKYGREYRAIIEVIKAKFNF